MNDSKPIHVAWVCQTPNSIWSKGILSWDHLLDFSTPLLLIQLSVCALLSSFMRFLLEPLGQSSFFSMMLVGFGMGPTVWGESNPIIRLLFPMKSYQIGQTIALFGCLIFLFVLGVKMDIAMVSKAGKKSVVIGILMFVVPLGLNLTVAAIISGHWELDTKLQSSVYTIASLQAISTYHVIVCVLADLKLLNSELGPVAASASMISGGLSYIVATCAFTIRQSQFGSPEGLIRMLLCVGFTVMIIAFVLRPIMAWMIKSTSEDKPIKEDYVISIFIMLLVSGFCSETLGQHLMFGAVALGAAVPSGPPLGSAVIYKLETFSSTIILPSYFVYTISGIDIFKVDPMHVAVVFTLAVTSSIAKLFASALPSLYCNMSPTDALSLGLIMSCQGLADVLLLQHAQFLYLVDLQTYSIMAFAIALLSGIFTPLIRLLYKPSRQYTFDNKRTIEQASTNSEFRMLACIYHDDSTPSLVSLLEVSNPTAKSPICCYVVHLMELTGRLSPIFIHHRPGRRSSSSSRYSNRIINAFRLYERHSNGYVMINLFTAISAFATIDEEVCRLAAKKRATMLIIPFHRQWRLHGLDEFKRLRPINKSILVKAPCSVGILVDRGTLGGVRSRTSSLYSIGVIFIEGKDDREALAYALRMADHPNVGVTLIHITDPERSRRFGLDRELDNGMITEFKIAQAGKRQHFYRNELVKDSADMIRVVKCLENTFELLIVGRNHDNISPLIEMQDWSEFPELGLMGDILASSDSSCEVSVLVVQQHRFGAEEKSDHMQIMMEDSKEAADLIDLSIDDGNHRKAVEKTKKSC